MAPSGLVMMLVSPLGARLSAARGPKVSLLAGTLVMVTGYGVGLLLMGSAWGMLAYTCVACVGLALAYAAMPALIMGAVPPAETAVANGLNTLMRSIGTSTSSAVVGVVLAHMTTDFGPVTLPSEAGFRTALAIAAGTGAVAALVILAIPGRAAAGGPPAAARVPAPRDPAAAPGPVPGAVPGAADA
jgi:MFS family permease